MNRFWNTVLDPLLMLLRPQAVVEIGAEYGTNTKRLLEYCGRSGATLHVIEPHPRFDVEAWQCEYPTSFRFFRDLSLNALGRIGQVDLALIDGDHNWYTVFHELRALERENGYPVVVLHDVGWPYGRRDLYYNPAVIPAEFRKLFRKAGLLPGQSALSDESHFNSDLSNATEEGGKGNGVLTAVEDFLHSRTDALDCLVVPVLHGLAIIYPRKLATDLDGWSAFVRSLTPSAGVQGLLELAESERVWGLVEKADRERENERLRTELHRLQRTVTELEQTAQRRCAVSSEIEMLDDLVSAQRAELSALKEQLKRVEYFVYFEEEQRKQLAALVARVENSFGYRLAAPLRWLKGPGLRRGLTVLRERIASALPESRAAWRQLHFSGSDHPRASVIIPVHNQRQYTLRCLQALRAREGSVSAEIIVVDDASTDETSACLALVSGIQLIRNVENQGFLRSCNIGARQARGEYFVFLNNDTEVQDGWLEELLGTFLLHPEAGLVGGKLFYADGRLQEAGAILWRDGRGWNYGRGDDPKKPEYSFLREVDYCSAACLAVPQGLFNAVGGFDERFAPAYYEDTDLAFQMRALGHRVYYQPHCRVLHHEGVSCGTDTASGVKAYQVSNREKFCAKWQSELAGQNAPGIDVGGASDRRRAPHLLVIDATLPSPDRDSGSVRMAALLRLLNEFPFQITIAAADLFRWEPYASDLERQGVEVLCTPQTASIEEHLLRCGARYQAVILSRAGVAEMFYDKVRRFCPQARLLFDTVDLHFLREERQAEIVDDLLLRVAARRDRRRECHLAALADVTFVVSEAERQILAQLVPEGNIMLLSNIHTVKKRRNSFAPRCGILFLGGFNHQPNIDAVRYFVCDIFSRVRAVLPEAQFTVIGGNVPEEVLELASEGVRILGHVSDIAPYLESVRLTVAPLRFGAGVKGKINTSMSYGVPVVCTSLAAEGMFIEHEREVLIGDDAESFARGVVRLYTDGELWERLSIAGQQNIGEHFSPAAARCALEAALCRDSEKRVLELAQNS